MKQKMTLSLMKKTCAVFMLVALAAPLKSFAFDYFETAAPPTGALVPQTFSTPEVACILAVQRLNNSTQSARYIGLRESGLTSWLCVAEITFLTGQAAGTSFIRENANGIALGRFCQPNGNNGAPWRDEFCNNDPDTIVSVEKSIGANQQCRGNPSRGNPIQLATGNKFQTEIDISSSNPLSFTRFYNSMLTSTYGVGKGWSANYLQFLTPSITNITEINRANGVKYFSLCPEIAGMCEVDNDLEITFERTNSGFTLITENDDIELYDTNGKLLSITQRSGEAQTLNYNATTDLLEIVTDAYGRTLSFAYDIQDRITSITDPSGDIYTYEYDSSGNLSIIYYPDDTPNDLTDNLNRQYLYTDTNIT